MSATFLCDCCGRERPLSERTVLDHRSLCPDCLSAHSFICHDCGNCFWQDDNAGTDEIPLCQDCYDENYTNCYHCGRLIREEEYYYESTAEDEDRPYCPSCFHPLSIESCIHDYYYKPNAIFYGDGPRFFGVELEIDNAGEIASNAAKLLKIVNKGGFHAYIKHDGSLDDGMEIVTHPMSLAYHQKHMPWAQLCQEAISLGYLSHRADTCGLHIHVSRTAFGTTEVEQDAAIARILYFFEKHWDELLKFSRRTPRQLERWAARYGYKEHPREILDHAKKGTSKGRYTCVNLTNPDTIEFRIFRGTLRYNTLIATLQMIDLICDMALYLSDDELKDLSWTTFVCGCTAPELIRYLKERRLYVNDPVSSEEEL